jgi:hypothetical protein
MTVSGGGTVVWAFIGAADATKIPTVSDAAARAVRGFIR